jgi:hypothetical protein
MNDKESSLQFDGLSISVCRGVDGTIVVQIDGPEDEANSGRDTVMEGKYQNSPDLRIYINDCLTYAHGQGGDNLGEEPLDPSVEARMVQLDEAMEGMA